VGTRTLLIIIIIIMERVCYHNAVDQAAVINTPRASRYLTNWLVDHYITMLRMSTEHSTEMMMTTTTMMISAISESKYLTEWKCTERRFLLYICYAYSIRDIAMSVVSVCPSHAGNESKLMII